MRIRFLAGAAVNPEQADRGSDAAQVDLERVGGKAGGPNQVWRALIDGGSCDDLAAAGLVLGAGGQVNGRAEVVEPVVEGDGVAWAGVDPDLEQVGGVGELAGVELVDGALDRDRGLQCRLAIGKGAHDGVTDRLDDGATGPLDCAAQDLEVLADQSEGAALPGPFVESRRAG